MLLLPLALFAQKNERSYLRSGNKLYKDSLFIKAEVDYRKALEMNPKSTEAIYNLGNSLSQQQKFQDAMEQYQAAARIEKDKMKLSEIYHNMGVLLQAGKQYPQCIEAYKQALRNNPKDDETRYNLALAQKMLKDQQQQNQDNQEQQQQEKEQEQQQQEQEQQQQEEQQDQQQQQPQQPQQEEQQDQQQQQPQQPQQEENEMSKENAEQLLNAAMQDERETQEKVKKQQRIQGRKLDKDW